MSAAQNEICEDEQRAERLLKRREKMKKIRKEREVKRRHVVTLEDAVAWLLKDYLPNLFVDEKMSLGKQFSDFDKVVKMTTPQMCRHFLVAGLDAYGFDLPTVQHEYRLHQLALLQAEVDAFQKEIDDGA